MDLHTVYADDYIAECLAALARSGADNVGGPWRAEGRGRWGRAIAAAFQSPFAAFWINPSAYAFVCASARRSRS